MYKITIWAHVNLGDEAQCSTFIVNAISKQAAIALAEKAKFDIAAALNWVDAKVERVDEMVCTCPNMEEMQAAADADTYSGPRFTSGTRIRYCVAHGAVPFTMPKSRGEKDAELEMARLMLNSEV